MACLQISEVLSCAEVFRVVAEVRVRNNGFKLQGRRYC